MCFLPIQKIFGSFTAEVEQKERLQRMLAIAVCCQSKMQLATGMKNKKQHVIADFFYPSGQNSKSN